MKALRWPSAVALRPLPPNEQLLVEGGDTRLALDPARGVNVYGCRAVPRPDVLAFSSSTASSISEHAARRLDRVRDRLAEGASAEDLAEDVRAELLWHLALDNSGVVAILAPSGTDAALHALWVARASLGTPLVSILAAADETGSGAPFAITGRHFNRIAARGKPVTPGDPIASLGDGVTLVEAKLRDTAGTLRDPDTVDREIFGAVERALAGGARVMLTAMDHSKLGNRSPGDACLASIEARFGDRVRIVVDACQARLGLKRLHGHLARGRMVMLTGSKFFGGPPLSGALLVPRPFVSDLARQRGLPLGLRDYAVASDYPGNLAPLRRSLLPEANLGQLMRWNAALEEIGAWFAMPGPRRRAAIMEFAGHAMRAIASHDALRLLPMPGAGDEDFPTPTIFPFLVLRDRVPLSPAQCGKLHRALNADLRSVLPSLSSEETELAARPCHIGQPVALAGGMRAALRISAGSRSLIDPSADLGADMDRVCAKIELLVRHFDAIDAAF